MSNILETFDFMKFFLLGALQGIIIFVKAFFNVGYPTNILVFLLLFGAPIVALIKSRFK